MGIVWIALVQLKKNNNNRENGYLVYNVNEKLLTQHILGPVAEYKLL